MKAGPLLIHFYRENIVSERLSFLSVSVTYVLSHSILEKLRGTKWQETKNPIQLWGICPHRCIGTFDLILIVSIPQ